LIFDDASTDNNQEVIKEYAEKHTNIKLFLQTENQWSQGKYGLLDWLFPAAQGKYIALCEGDDYWSDPLKLQKQFDFLQNNLDYSACAHQTEVIFENSNKACSWGGIKIHPDFHGKGYGKLTALLLVKFVFEELNIERYEAQCLEEHVVSKKMMEKVGFVTEGLRRNSIFKNGKYHNQLVFSLLKSEYPVIKEQYKL
jgi:RimJ/RimL family protein N-acetyltransferase